MRVAYCDRYAAPLPRGHRFPMGKYAALERLVRRERMVAGERCCAPEPASWETIALVHTREYVRSLRAHSLPERLERRLGLRSPPSWSSVPATSQRGSLAMARAALDDGLAANLAGGSHHGFADRGEGFCVLNDVAIAIRALRSAGELGRVLVIDLDVHQGDGTARIFAGDPEVYTLSLHGARNYPFRKERSSRDVELSDGLDDAQYLEVLGRELPRALAAARPELLVYLAGVDVSGEDRLGRLRLSEDGIAARDRAVLELGWRSGLPLLVLPAGGYPGSPERAAELHALVHREAAVVYGL